ncbi:hypothetical protein N9D31_04240 [Oligoflexaceae bacterium]|nr:hypothetical protein [Oligoflexaceae bacterium]
MKFLILFVLAFVQTSCGKASDSYLKQDDQPSSKAKVIFSEKMFTEPKPSPDDIGVLVTIYQLNNEAKISYRLKVVNVTNASVTPVERGIDQRPRFYKVDLTLLPIGTAADKSLLIYTGRSPMRLSLLDLSAYQPMMKLDGINDFSHTFSEKIDGVTKHYVKVY